MKNEITKERKRQSQTSIASSSLLTKGKSKLINPKTFRKEIIAGISSCENNSSNVTILSEVNKRERCISKIGQSITRWRDEQASPQRHFIASGVRGVVSTIVRPHLTRKINLAYLVRT